MRGKRAKMLRRLAVKYLPKDTTPGTGYNTYNVVQNHIEWVPALDGDGKVMTDPDTGQALIKPQPANGTITSAWMLRIIYQGLKRLWKNGTLQHSN